MHLVTYYVALRTGVNYTPTDYIEKAGALLQLYMDIMNTPDSVSKMVKGHADEVHSEITVKLEHTGGSEWELILEAAVDVQGEHSPLGKLDKSKLSAAIKAHDLNEWPLMRVEKKVAAV